MYKQCTMYTQNTAPAAETFPGVATGGERGGGLEVHMNLMPPGVTKISFYSIF